MTQSEYVEEVARLVIKHKPDYIKVVSPIVAQFCLESGYGTSDKVKLGQQYVGLKYRENRCPSGIGWFTANGSEQDANTLQYTTSAMKWQKCKNLENCVVCYFEFTSISNYSNLRNVTDAKTYLENIKKDGFATSVNYVDNCMRVIEKWNLTRFDNVGKKIKIAIDAGHGSNTSGKRTPDNYLEHWINVKTAYACEQYLQKHGIETVRVGWGDIDPYDDPDVPLADRQKQIKNANCDYSISCHANAYGDGKSYNSGEGVETLYHIDASKRGDSEKMANAVQKRLIQGTPQKNRGAKTQSLAMCNTIATGCKASILIEIGFMTNLREADLMKTQDFCIEQGEDAAKGILDYLGIAEKPIETVVEHAETVKNVPFIVKLKDDLNIRKTPNGDIVKPNGAKKGICYTIVDVSGNWGKLKSGAGWICITDKYVTKL